MSRNPLWYKDAIIYQAHVRAFLDTNQDGVGDFRGLTEKLDYLQALGIDTIWLQPFYPSPLRDDGYDIADYENINPAYGTLEDFDRFIAEAHARQLRVITELVINHTSDQHPWFQAARHAPPGSPERDFYVWSDTNQKYQGVPIIFSDSEKSNWTWDDTAGAYYWHRFFHHQPDLNFDNPAVLDAVTQVMHFWLDRGVDGMRLDAVPYLIEREGTPCANLDETHAVLKQIRAEMDCRHHDRLFLAEANQWPADVRPYFGDGDECHMAFHFPLMPRMFMAVRQEDRHPIVEILRQTPDIPDNCQWGIFLRNHDELTLEMVTDEERDYMYQWYANDPQMRINGGIRRRLAPLMENSRRRIELMNSLLMSLPGTPVIYYGDELGMGDNIYLGDRNAVRTPMQWTGDRNAGFSRADSARLFAPVITDPVYGFAAVNVEAQERAPFSLLNWMKRLIALRRQLTVFGRGTIEFLPAQNRKVLAYIRQYDSETVLCVANLSRTVQPVELDLSRYRGMSPVEMLGQTEFPRIGEAPYFLSLSAYGFMWFRLQVPAAPITERSSSETPVSVTELPALMVGTVWETLLDGTVRTLIERDLLAAFIFRQPWFQGPRPRAARFKDWGLLRRGTEPLFFSVVEVEFDENTEDGPLPPRQYYLPLSLAAGETARSVQDRFPQAVLARITGARKGVLYDGWHDGWHDDRFAEVQMESVNAGTTTATSRGLLQPEQMELIPPLRRASDSMPVSRPGSTAAASSSLSYANRMTLKLFRRVEPGVHPEVEITRHLTQVGFTRTPAVAAVVDYVRPGEARSTTAMIQQAVEIQADGWTYATEWLSRFFDHDAARELPSAEVPRTLLELISTPPPVPVQEHLGTYLEIAATLGRRSAEMHRALATAAEDPAFTAEPFTSDDGVYAQRRGLAQAERTLRALEASLASGRLQPAGDAVDRVKLLLERREALIAEMTADLTSIGPSAKIRIHGDYRLAQVMLAEGDFYIQSFEGHLAWPAAALREKQSPLRDIASLLRSFSYASHAALLSRTTAAAEDSTALAGWARLWETWTMAAFLRNYLELMEDAAVLPASPAEREQLLRFFMLDRALRELDGELNNRPEWVGIPTIGILDLLRLG